MPDHRTKTSNESQRSKTLHDRSSSPDYEEHGTRRLKHKERETSSFAQREFLECYYRTISKYPTSADKKMLAKELELYERPCFVLVQTPYADDARLFFLQK